MADFSKLELSTETLRELRGDELVDVVGGTTPITRTCTPIVSYVPCYLVGQVILSVEEGCLP